MNSNRTIFLASFLTLIVAGMGFAVRAKALGDWGAEFGFTKTELGTITGGGLVGFGVTIIICSLFIDHVGYKPLMVIAFLLHILSTVVTLAATPVFEVLQGDVARDGAYWCLYIGTFIFALSNGICEAVINPLTATLYPQQKTHYLNILHAGWPGGLIVGGLLAWAFVGDEAVVTRFRWEVSLALYLIPTVAYGLLMYPHRFPISEARAAGVEFRTMLLELASPILLLLLLLHAMVGYVELGTDSWITDIMNNVIKGQATLLFVYTSALMFVLRFFARPIVERINPVGLLTASSLTGCAGLFWLSNATLGWAIFLAATTYGIGKTFLWPTMLGVVSERFPKGGALTMGAVGAMGALSAGLLGGPMIGYKQDHYASQELKQKSLETYDRYASAKPNAVLFLPPIKGLDGAKVDVLKDAGMGIRDNVEVLKKRSQSLEDDKDLKTLINWWETAKDHQPEDELLVNSAVLHGGRMALKLTALVPLMMALLYGLLALYFRSTGGYKVEQLAAEQSEESVTNVG